MDKLITGIKGKGAAADGYIGNCGIAVPGVCNRYLLGFWRIAIFCVFKSRYR